MSQHPRQILAQASVTTPKLHATIPQTLQFFEDESHPKGGCNPHSFFCLVPFMSMFLKNRAGSCAANRIQRDSREKKLAP